MNDKGIGPQGYYQKYYSDRNWQSYAVVLATVIRYSEPGPILDVGAGCGYFVEAASLWGLHATGLDGADEAIKMAKTRSQTLDIHLHRLSESLPFPDNSFQTVVMNQVIEHLEPAIAEYVLKEAIRILRPRGMILITSPSKANKAETIADPTHINMMSPSELNALVRKAGFNRTIASNSPLDLLGKTWFARGVMLVLFKIMPLDCLSATANIIGHK